MSAEITDLLSRIPMFSGLTPEELGTVGRHVELIAVDKGGVVFNEGEPGESVCFVVDGVLDVTKKSLIGETTRIAALSKGDSIGEMSLVDKLTRSATVKARTDATMMVLSRAHFDAIVKESPSIAIEILKGISRTLSLHLRRVSTTVADHLLPCG